MNYKLYFKQFSRLALACLLASFLFASCSKPEKSFVVYSTVGAETIANETHFELKEQKTLTTQTQKIRVYSLLKFEYPIVIEQ